MAAEIVYALRGATVSGADVAGAASARLIPQTQFSIDPGGPSSEFDADAVVTHLELAIELYGRNDLTVLGLLGGSNVAVVLETIGAATAEETLTLSAVDITDALGAAEFPAQDAGGKIAASAGVRGYQRFAAGEDFSDVLAAA